MKSFSDDIPNKDDLVTREAWIEHARTVEKAFKCHLKLVLGLCAFNLIVTLICLFVATHH